MSAAYDITFEEAEALLEEECDRAYERLRAQVIAFEQAVAAGKVVQTSMGGEWRWLQWDAVCKAYRALRGLYVQHRIAPKKKLKVDPSLLRWSEERQDFWTGFYGPKEADGKRHFLGVDPEVRDTIQRYQRLHGKWHKKTTEYKVQRAKSAKKRGTNRTEAAKAAKAKWKLSPAGQAWWTAQAEKRKAATAKRKAAKLLLGAK